MCKEYINGLQYRLKILIKSCKRCVNLKTIIITLHKYNGLGT